MRKILNSNVLAFSSLAPENELTSDLLEMRVGLKKQFY